MADRSATTTTPPLRRDTSDNIWAGVAKGIATRLDLAPWLVRLAFIFTSFFGGIGLVLARELAVAGAGTKLVLVGRSGLEGDDERTARRRAAVVSHAAAKRTRTRSSLPMTSRTCPRTIRRRRDPRCPRTCS